MNQSVVSSRPNEHINIEDAPGHEIVMSHGTVVLVLCGENSTAAEDHNLIVRRVFDALSEVDK